MAFFLSCEFEFVWRWIFSSRPLGYRTHGFLGTRSSKESIHHTSILYRRLFVSTWIYSNRKFRFDFNEFSFVSTTENLWFNSRSSSRNCPVIVVKCRWKNLSSDNNFRSMNFIDIFSYFVASKNSLYFDTQSSYIYIYKKSCHLIQLTHLERTNNFANPQSTQVSSSYCFEDQVPLTIQIPDQANVYCFPAVKIRQFTRWSMKYFLKTVKPSTLILHKNYVHTSKEE